MTSPAHLAQVLAARPAPTQAPAPARERIPGPVTQPRPPRGLNGRYHPCGAHLLAMSYADRPDLEAAPVRTGWVAIPGSDPTGHVEQLLAAGYAFEDSDRAPIVLRRAHQTVLLGTCPDC